MLSLLTLMRNNLIFILATMLVIFNSCSYTQKASRDFLETLNTTKQSVNKLNFDGYYSNEKGIDHYLKEYENGKEVRFKLGRYFKFPLIFFSNGFVKIEQYDKSFIEPIFYTNTKISESYYKEFPVGNWGTYKIIGDTLEAIIYLNYMGKSFRRNQLLETHFKGVLKNNDTIFQWKMIPPMPKIDTAFEYVNKDSVRYLITPKDLFFTSIPETKSIDPNKAWINKYYLKKTNKQ